MTLWLLRFPTTAISHRQTGVFCAGGVLAVLAMAAVGIDMRAARWLRDLHLTGDLARLIRLAEVFAWGGSVALIISVAAVLDRRSWRVALVLGMASLGSGIAADAVKLLVGRTRPEATALETTMAGETFVAWLPGPNSATHTSYSGHALQSFPSAHAATAVGLAIGLATLYPRGRWLFLLFTGLACFQRLAARAHYPSDVLAGAAIGCIVAGLSIAWLSPVGWDKAAAADGPP